ncbi:S-adenosyl-L-methionine-dependent methyltransferase [Xylariales sp. PMI_506]|nr:S-adenosyl-L-methionine-dependent methyltransferase [Xylariales sp. PMI_506]
MPGPGFAAMAKERALALRKHIFSLPSARFEGKPLEVLKEINDFADNQRLPMTFRGYKMELAQRALSAMAPKPKVLVEFGTFVGCSALGWGAHLTELNGGSDGVRVYGFELDPEVAQIARDLVKLAGLEEVVTVLDGPGADSLKKLVGDGTVKAQSVDAVFIDHWEQLYVSDLRVCEELGVLHVGSIIMADNTDFPGAPDYVEYVRAGGSGQPGAVRYVSRADVPENLQAANPRKPRVLEVSTVIQA